MIRIGRLSWLLHDQAAWATATGTWRQVADIAPLVLAAPRTGPRPRRDNHRPGPTVPEVPAAPPAAHPQRGIDL